MAKQSKFANILNTRELASITTNFCLTDQHRVRDAPYEEFLNHISYWQPTEHLLGKIQKGKVVCQDRQPSDKDITDLLLEYPNATFPTVSRKASYFVNNAVSQQLFMDCVPLAKIQCRENEEPIDIFKNMRVMITENRDKSMGVVNGQVAAIHTVQGHTILLKLQNDKIVYIHPVTSNIKGKILTYYPIMPAYGLTITKAQGQTLQKVIIWFDTTNTPVGCGYVALSRVRRADDLIPLTPIRPQHVKPVNCRTN